MTADEAAESSPTESWDSFWAEVRAKEQVRTEVIRDVEVAVPTDLPLALVERADELQTSGSEADIHELVARLFGKDVYGEWVANGMGLREFKVVLAWGMAQGRGTDISFAEAYKAVVDVEQGKDQPTPANRAERRAQSKSTGGRSKRTSSGSTGSARKTSRS
ncbi:hypothetical protein AB0M28_13415 [Streptomyces sp. NPDC051940]|uniref:hypothetical protein n=1 Tax=Streptomyces sp. NPDC051940 TaxID=3155675 RepID=UPI00343F81D9